MKWAVISYSPFLWDFLFYRSWPYLLLSLLFFSHLDRSDQSSCSSLAAFSCLWLSLSLFCISSSSTVLLLRWRAKLCTVVTCYSHCEFVLWVTCSKLLAPFFHIIYQYVECHEPEHESTSNFPVLCKPTIYSWQCFNNFSSIDHVRTCGFLKCHWGTL